LVPGNAEEFAGFLPIGTKEGKRAAWSEVNALFKYFSLGVATHRDSVVYDFKSAALAERANAFIEDYNLELDRYRRSGGKASPDSFVRYDRIIWDRDLKKDLQRGKYASFEEAKIRVALYRPFNKRFLFFDRVVNAEVYSLPDIFPTPEAEAENRVIVTSQIGFRAQTYNVLISKLIPDLHLCASIDGHQCFPFYVYDEDGSNRRENITHWAVEQFRDHYGDQRINKWGIFYYIYGVLHHPGYCEKFADNLKRELPRIPFAPDFVAFATAGEELARMHLDYEKLAPYPLKWVETPGVPLSYRVEDKMRLSKDKARLVVNKSLTLAGIPPETFQYRLGNRSALEWVIDQYQLREDKRSGIRFDPNRADDPEYIVRLVGQVVRVSLETVRIVVGLPEQYTQ
jgi:predicted helicase